MANCGPRFFINFLKSEYGVSRDGPAELADVLQNQVRTTLNSVQIESIRNSKKLSGLDESVLLEAATALYIRQEFRGRP